MYACVWSFVDSRPSLDHWFNKRKSVTLHEHIVKITFISSVRRKKKISSKMNFSVYLFNDQGWSKWMSLKVFIQKFVQSWSDPHIDVFSSIKRSYLWFEKEKKYKWYLRFFPRPFSLSRSFILFDSSIIIENKNDGVDTWKKEKKNF